MPVLRKPKFDCPNSADKIEELIKKVLVSKPSTLTSSTLLEALSKRAGTLLRNLKIDIKPEKVDDIKSYLAVILLVWLIASQKDSQEKLFNLDHILKDENNPEINHAFVSSSKRWKKKTLKKKSLDRTFRCARDHYAKELKRMYLIGILNNYQEITNNKEKLTVFFDNIMWDEELLLNNMSDLSKILSIFEHIKRDEGHGIAGGLEGYALIERILHKLKYYISICYLAEHNFKLLILDNNISSILDVLGDKRMQLDHNIISSNDEFSCANCGQGCPSKLPIIDKYSDGQTGHDLADFNIICFDSIIKYLQSRDPSKSLFNAIQDYFRKLCVNKKFPFDALILDIYLNEPQLYENVADGIDILEGIKKDRNYYNNEIDNVPCIMLTSYNDPGHIIRAINADADWYVKKLWITHGSKREKLEEETVWDLVTSVYELYHTKSLLQEYYITLWGVSVELENSIFMHRSTRHDSELIILDNSLEYIENAIEKSFPSGTVPRYLYNFFKAVKNINKDLREIIKHYTNFEWIDVKYHTDRVIAELEIINTGLDVRCSSNNEANINRKLTLLMMNLGKNSRPDRKKWLREEFKISIRNLANISKSKLREWAGFER